MPLINAGSLLGLAESYRLIWIGGRFGGHKTSFTYYLARNWLERGYRLVTNNRCVWADNLDEVQLLSEKSHHLQAVVILDEGGLQFKASRQVEAMCAYAAKMDCIYLIPSFFPPTRSAQVLSIQPVFSFLSVGIPLVVYRWRITLGQFRDSSWFAWWNPSEIYGVYSRQDPGEPIERIMQFMIDRTADYRAAYGREDSIPTLEVTDNDRTEDAANAFSEAADNLIAIAPALSRRKHR